jgi:hypothetical protein
MKKGYVVALVLLIAVDVPALEFAYTISGGELGFYSNFLSPSMYAHLVNFSVQEKSGLGIQITPLRTVMDFPISSSTALTFVNAILYYDFFGTKEEIQLGPFVSINTVNVLKIDSVEIDAGLLFSLRIFGSSGNTNLMTCLELLTARAGYRYLDGASNFYAQIGLDLLAVGSILAASQGDKDPRKDVNSGYRYYLLQ